MPYLVAVAASVGLLAAYIASRPKAFRIQRARTIAATPEQLFALVHDFHAWGAWSPWEKLDPAMERTYEGPSAGEGAVYRWSGAKSGAGSMQITGVTPGERVEIDLRFTKPIAADNRTVFAFEPQGASTRVTWTMSGERNFASKAFDTFFNMDKLVGRDFDKGLEAMEAATRPA